ncbi:hypothetical protein [Paraburkholderia sp. SIMBA_054]|uniref:hypothetical protein n=1 Tax=Paraburkholderia sp. SIMBA_054 TaxID=3085795 RepID=UPI00397D03CA
MLAYEKAKKLHEWLKERADATVAEMVASGVLSKTDVRSALDYGTRRGVFESAEHDGRALNARVSYSTTGVPLLAPEREKGRGPVASFEGLQAAFGIALYPPRVTGLVTRRYTVE